MNAHPITAMLLALSLTACATTGGKPSSETRAGFEGAVTQPLTDLSLMREVSPPALVEAAAAPYELSEGFDCAAARAAVDRLDAVLGPDVDMAPAKRPGAGSALLIGALKGVVSLPYRGMIRKISGAETRERLKVQAVLAGMVRRGYLKGWMRSHGCPPPSPPPA